MFIDSYLGVFAHFGVAAVLNTVDLITASTLHCNRMETDNTLQQNIAYISRQQSITDI